MSQKEIVAAVAAPVAGGMVPDAKSKAAKAPARQKRDGSGS